MKILFLIIDFLLLAFVCFSAEEMTFTDLEGPYMGQGCPKHRAEVFLDGIICIIDQPEMCAAFTKDGKEFYFNRLLDNNWTIFFMCEINGRWTQPEPMPFSAGYTDRDFTISPDGEKIYFGSNRPLEDGGEKLKNLDIYVTARGKNYRWSKPRNAGSPVNTAEYGENYPSIASNGNLYFFSCRDKSKQCEIYVSTFSDGVYLTPKNLGPAINSVQNDWDAFIAPDESYIIFSSQNRDDTIGDQDLYISFNKSGTWTDAINMGSRVNSFSSEICPSVSLDGKYLFFTSRRRGKADIFWISADIIKELDLKPAE